MPNFKQMHQFVSFVQAYNTRDNKEDDATLNNLTDLNYKIIKAFKKDNALRRFQNEHTGYDNPKVAKIYSDAKELGFIKHLTSEDNQRVEGEILLVEPKGEEFLHTTRVLNLKTGKWLAWTTYYYKPLVILGAFLGSAVSNVIIRLLV